MGFHRDEDHEEHLREHEQPVGHVVRAEPVREHRGQEPDPPHRHEHRDHPRDARRLVQVRDRGAHHEDRGDEDEVVEQLEPRRHLRGRVRGWQRARKGGGSSSSRERQGTSSRVTARWRRSLLLNRRDGGSRLQGYRALGVGVAVTVAVMLVVAAVGGGSGDGSSPLASATATDVTGIATTPRTTIPPRARRRPRHP